MGNALWGFGWGDILQECGRGRFGHSLRIMGCGILDCAKLGSIRLSEAQTSLVEQLDKT